eukprot:scaffold26569_cov107-Isochrysis_galbana.AAC.1
MPRTLQAYRAVCRDGASRFAHAVNTGTGRHTCIHRPPSTRRQISTEPSSMLSVESRRRLAVWMPSQSAHPLSSGRRCGRGGRVSATSCTWKESCTSRPPNSSCDRAVAPHARSAAMGIWSCRQVEAGPATLPTPRGAQASAATPPSASPLGSRLVALSSGLVEASTPAAGACATLPTPRRSDKGMEASSAAAAALAAAPRAAASPHHRIRDASIVGWAATPTEQMETLTRIGPPPPLPKSTESIGVGRDERSLSAAGGSASAAGAVAHAPPCVTPLCACVLRVQSGTVAPASPNRLRALSVDGTHDTSLDPSPSAAAGHRPSRLAGGW